MDARTDVKTVYPPQTKFAGGIIKAQQFHTHLLVLIKGVQWLSGRVLDLRPRGRRLGPYCVVVSEQDTFILA